MLTIDNWEQGSEFHLVSDYELGASASLASSNTRYFGSGRDALRALIHHGMTERFWQRMWLPSYFCQDVIESIASTGIKIEFYPDYPDKSESKFPFSDNIRSHDVILNVNYFGLRSKPLDRIVKHGDIEIIEDHSHDPWSLWATNSEADWCIASLRKTLPLPDGAVLWSPTGHKLPDARLVTQERENSSLFKLAAMALKSAYLSGDFDDKSAFRKYAVLGEGHIASGAISGMTGWSQSLYSAVPIQKWRQLRYRNYNILCDRLAGIPWVTLLRPFEESGECPFSAILLFESSMRREYMRERLISANIYPAVLWPLLPQAIHHKIPEENLIFCSKMLSIHCDMRYTEDDMLKVALLIIKIGEEYNKIL